MKYRLEPLQAGTGSSSLIILSRGSNAAIVDSVQLLRHEQTHQCTGDPERGRGLPGCEVETR